MGVEFGVGAWSLENIIAAPRSWHQRHIDALHFARRAEALGFESMWFAEHHHVYSGYNSAQFPIFAACAAVTERIKVCGGVSLLPIQGAYRISEGAAALDSIAPGRLRMALALGYAGREYRAAGIDRKKKVSIMEAQLDRLFGDLAERIGATELWIGAHAHIAMRRAARYAMPIFIQQVFDPEEVRAIRRICEEEAEQRAVRVTGARQQIHIHNTIWANKDVGSRDRAKQRWHAMLQHYGTHIMKEDADIPATGVSYDPRDACLIGSPQQVVDGLARLIEGGADGIHFHMQTTSAEPGDVEEQMEIIASEVLPHLRGLK